MSSLGSICSYLALCGYKIIISYQNFDLQHDIFYRYLYFPAKNIQNIYIYCIYMYYYILIILDNIFLLDIVPWGGECERPVIVFESWRQSLPQLLDVLHLEDGGVAVQGGQRPLLAALAPALLAVPRVQGGAQLGADLKELLFEWGKNVWKLTRYQTASS